MLRTGIILIALLGFLNLKGQEITARLDLGRKDAIPEQVIYCPADKGIVTLGNISRKSSRNLGISKYGPSFEKEWSRPVLEKNGRNNVDFVAVTGSQVLVFTSEYFPKISTIKTICKRYGLDGKPSREPEVISELSNEAKHKVDLQYRQSINKRYMMAYKNLNINQGFEEIMYFIFDSQSDLIRKGSVKVPYPDDKFHVKEILLTNQGNLLILGKHYKVNKVRNPDDFEYLVFMYNTEYETGSQIMVNFDGIFITDLAIKTDKDENIYLAGFYSEKNSSQIIGTIYQRLNKDLEVEVSAPQRFSEEFLMAFLSDKQIEKGKELKNFYLDDIILRSDGGVLLVAERFYVTYNSFLDINGYWVNQKIYHYDEVIVNSVDPNGNLEWSASVYKRQSSTTQSNLSYFDVISGGNIFLLYEVQPRKSPRTVYYNTIDLQGNVGERKMLLKGELGNTFYPGASEQISNSEAMLIYYQDRSKLYSITKIAF